MQTALHRIRRPLEVTSAGVIGMLAGAMALIKVVLVPFWLGMAPREFRAWFAAYSGRIRGVMGPLGMAGLGTAFASTVVESKTSGDSAAPAVAAAASAGVVAITLAVNERANAKFVLPDLEDDETVDLLRRWSRWHTVRVGLGLAATAAAATAVSARR